MRSNILEKYPSSSVRVYVVWFNMLPGDARNLVDRKVLNDHRVVNYYDPNRVVGSWFAEHTEGSFGMLISFMVRMPHGLLSRDRWSAPAGR